MTRREVQPVLEALWDDMAKCAWAIVQPMLLSEIEPDGPEFPAWFVGKCLEHGLEDRNEQEAVRSYIMWMFAALGADPGRKSEIATTLEDALVARLSGRVH